jgi:hypothetical protein
MVTLQSIESIRYDTVLYNTTRDLVLLSNTTKKTLLCVLLLLYQLLTMQKTRNKLIETEFTLSIRLSNTKTPIQTCKHYTNYSKAKNNVTTQEGRELGP